MRITLEPFAEGLSDPVLVTHAGDASGTLYAIEQAGRIRAVDARGSVAADPFLDIRDRISSGGERGLLGLAFHPEYASNSRFFVNYTDTNGDTVIAEYRGAGARAQRDSERILLRIDQPFANHNGGALAFGPDGFLYVGMGDGGSGGDPMNNGQRRDTLLGKILRIDVAPAGDRPYAIPRDNPFAREGGAPEIWALGMRNPWRLSFDRATDALFIADVGQGEFEEIDVQPQRGGGGRNYGWRVMEGAECYQAESCDRDGLTPPIAQYTHDDGCSVTGGYVYRGSRYPALVGAYLFGDYCSGAIWALDAAAALRGPTAITEVARTDLSISSFGEDEQGELYVVDHGGRLFRVALAGA